jgi:uncharacterized membrane protein
MQRIQSIETYLSKEKENAAVSGQSFRSAQTTLNDSNLLSSIHIPIQMQVGFWVLVVMVAFLVIMGLLYFATRQKTVYIRE